MKQLAVDEVAEVVAGYSGVVVEFAVLALGGGPALPTVGLVEDEGAFPVVCDLAATAVPAYFRTPFESVFSRTLRV